MRLPREKLAVRLAVVGALQVLALLVVAALAVPLSFYLQDRASPQGIARSIEHVLSKPAELERRVMQLSETQQVGLSLYDQRGTLVVSNISPPLVVRHPWGGPPPGAFVASGDAGYSEPRPLRTPPPPLDHRGPRPPWAHGPFDWLSGAAHEPPVIAMALRDGEEPYTLVVRLPRLSANYLPLIAIVVSGILVVWLGARLTARFITSPLERLSQVVAQFGAGELSVRSDSLRRDEVGLLANTFNQMADGIQRLRQTERELLSNVAHELRTPLARIRVALEIADEGDGATAKKALLGINEDLRELESLIEDVFTASSLQSGRGAGGLVLRRAEIEVPALIASVLSRFRANYPDRPVTVGHSTPSVTLLGDEVLLRRALSNLLENAHKYTPDGGMPITLTVSTSSSPRDSSTRATNATGCEGVEHVVFEIEDSGVGIAPDEHAKVFLPFYRAEQSRSRATGGVGLGLTLTKRIVEAHAGRIELESELGRGTTVRLVLPMRGG